jgi:hypothetical protein
MRALWAAVPILLAGTAASSAEVADGPQIFTRSAWVCRSPEDYKAALDETARTGDPEEVADKLLDEGRCMYLEADDIEDIFAPFVLVRERAGDLAKVSFTIEFYRRVGTLGGRYSAVKFTGWTDAAGLKPHR